ncbi:RraA family protein [Methanobrevibacter filiformis]|uniref:Putative regulator of ribonuclease activity n=1 Tax=Methanobrevibacter filiformis TaxID=55758 RepID=A0A166AJZ2_9EURY|nr:hypothetical protein [Methanobrevibacter filiformis]KZX12132.1 putative regulator of ribonuclease activity [Methanobrevibacter filiformis]
MSSKKLSPKSFLNDFYKSKVKDYDYENITLFDVIDLNNKNSINDFIGENLDNLDITKLYDDLDGKINNLKLLLESTSACQISDALSDLSNNNGVIKTIKSINNQKAYGVVVTAETDSNDWGTSLIAIDKAKKGEILFIHAPGESSAIWGELTSTSSKSKGISGTVIVGATRDIDFLINYDYPVFASSVVPNAGKAYAKGKINVPINIDGVNVLPGDFIFADESGVVVIPKGIFKLVMRQLIDIKINEFNIISEINKGKAISEILNL